MVNIGQILSDIQYATGLTIEQVADKIGYTRQHLTTMAKHGGSNKAYNLLRNKYGNAIINKLQKRLFELQREMIKAEIMENNK